MKRRLVACLCGLGIVAAAALAVPLSASADGYVPSNPCATSTPEPSTGSTPGSTPESTPGSTPASCNTPATLSGSVVTGKCVANAPWIFYDIVVDNPDHVTLSGHDVIISMNDGKGNTWSETLGTISTATEGPGATENSLTLSGKTLWPGASVAADGVTPTGWPGWTQNAAGDWVETSGNFAWTRTITSATITVNPELSVAVSYPPATPSCNAGPPSDGTSADANWLADTGSNVMFGVVAGGAILILGGSALAFALIRRRRATHES
ncbi:hypothetical protein HII28_08395 [Planctomonas sp. JC2975]|uniref:hypothetical protein n=1 Tax=Planctomonas sp. JC2975 TaxID=2729626 RepID=UPI0014749F95|nr:hypothetical protein [Planctomonas sp. JC2975]NNC11897.1 hypothetical protein [Planctomonas sp. JC2975]